MTSPFDDGSGRFTAVLDEIAQSQSIRRIAKVVTHGARSLLGADGVTFVLQEEGSCHYFDEEAISPLWKGRKFPMSACISGWVMENDQPVSIPDITLDARIPQDAYRPTFVRSLIMVPFRSESVVGAIGAYWAAKNRAKATDLTKLAAIAKAASVVL